MIYPVPALENIAHLKLNHGNSMADRLAQVLVTGGLKRTGGGGPEDRLQMGQEMGEVPPWARVRVMFDT